MQQSLTVRRRLIIAQEPLATDARIIGSNEIGTVASPGSVGVPDAVAQDPYPGGHELLVTPLR
ncbi:MAG: hypothetical protein WCE87_06165 [Candidatus Udaeobacter sp.]